MCVFVHKKLLVVIHRAELGMNGLGIETLHAEQLKCACVNMCVSTRTAKHTHY